MTMTIMVTPHTGGFFFHFIYDLLTNEPPAQRRRRHCRPRHRCCHIASRHHHQHLSPPPPPRSCHITAVTPSITTTIKMTATSPHCHHHDDAIATPLLSPGGTLPPRLTTYHLFWTTCHPFWTIYCPF